jgi:hypothetical protein
VIRRVVYCRDCSGGGTTSRRRRGSGGGYAVLYQSAQGARRPPGGGSSTRRTTYQHIVPCRSRGLPPVRISTIAGSSGAFMPRLMVSKTPTAMVAKLLSACYI